MLLRLLSLPLGIALAVVLAIRAHAQDTLAESSGEVVEGQTTFVLPDTTALDATQRALLRLERARSAAIARHDTTFLKGIYAEDFRGVTATGYPVDRARLMYVFSLDNPQARFRLSDLSFRVFGETAVTTGLLETFEGGTLRHAQRLLHVYVRRGGRWQMMAGQGTLLPTPGSPGP